MQVLGPNGEGFLKSVIAIAGGEAHNVAVTSDGKVWTWGVLGNDKLSRRWLTAFRTGSRQFSCCIR